MNVLFVSPEVNPLVRTGGLGDVVGSLPLALKKLGIDVRVICPFHKECEGIESKTLEKNFVVEIDKKIMTGTIRQTKLGNSDVPAYMIDLPEFYDRNGIYSDKHGDFRTMHSVHLP